MYSICAHVGFYAQICLFGVTHFLLNTQCAFEVRKEVLGGRWMLCNHANQQPARILHVTLDNKKGLQFPDWFTLLSSMWVTPLHDCYSFPMPVSVYISVYRELWWHGQWIICLYTSSFLWGWHEWVLTLALMCTEMENIVQSDNTWLSCQNTEQVLSILAQAHKYKMYFVHIFYIFRNILLLLHDITQIRDLMQKVWCSIHSAITSQVLCELLEAAWVEEVRD